MKFSKFALLLFLLLFLLQTEIFAQVFRNDSIRNAGQNNKANSPSWRDKVRLGGNFGLQFGSITFINVSPLVMYQATDRTQIGVGITYQYVRFSSTIVRNASGSSIFGGRVFARYFLFPGIFAHGEYEMLNNTYYDPLVNELRRDWIPAGFAGGGYSQQLGGGRSAFNVTILYNLLYEQYQSRSIYASPWVIRMGITL
ncbi:MAG: hypothetical protein EAZ08_04000 [Cytophagales bacterium]|nr:MAG: hypothetical protein EAZ08_04000 [Cytophagales bacterium]